MTDLDAMGNLSCNRPAASRFDSIRSPTLSVERGPEMVSREERTAADHCPANVRGRDLGSFVDAPKQQVKLATSGSADGL